MEVIALGYGTVGWLATWRPELATLCYMRTVTHREMRNSSAEILRAVAAGETIQITNNGVVAAILSPPQPTTLEDLIARGQARPVRRPIDDLLSIERVDSKVSSREIIEETRGRW